MPHLKYNVKIVQLIKKTITTKDLCRFLVKIVGGRALVRTAKLVKNKNCFKNDYLERIVRLSPFVSKELMMATERSRCTLRPNVMYIKEKY